MTTHFFVLKDETDEEKETRLKQGDSSWFTRILPSGLTLDRSAIRLNVQEELEPPQPIQHPNASQTEQVVTEPKQYPYVCFVETTGLLVVISHSGYCCKFSIEFEEETPVNDLRTKRYNNRKRIGSRSPIRHTLKLKLGSAE